MNSSVLSMSKWHILLGNLFEHYDTALFALLSPLMASLFFPEYDPVTALILTYCMIPVGMLARPIGALVFGFIGDQKSRKDAVVLSLLGMAIVTACVGFIPTYQHIGIIAPILLSLCRMLQNFFLGGETVGGAIYLLEESVEAKKNIMSGIYGSSTIAGILLASAAVSGFYFFAIIEEYWRLLYFFGSFTALFALLLRLSISSSTRENKDTPSFSLPFFLTTVCKEWRALVSIAFASGFSYASYVMSLVMINGIIPLVTPISQGEMMHLNTFLLVIDFLLLPLFGMLADRFSREYVMATAGFFAALACLPLFWFMEGASIGLVFFIRLVLLVIGVWFSAPFYAWAGALLPPSCRYMILSFGYAIGSQIIGGPTALVSLWLFQKTGLITSIGWYWMILGLFNGWLILQSSKKRISLNVRIG